MIGTAVKLENVSPVVGRFNCRGLLPGRLRLSPSRVGDLKSERLIRWIVAGAVGIVLFGALLLALFRVGGQTVSQLTSNRERSASMRNLERIAAALNAYAADYGTYPPSATRDSTGKKLHSWRVLILPYLGEDELYNKFDLSVPWDHPRTCEPAYEMPVLLPASQWQPGWVALHGRPTT